MKHLPPNQRSRIHCKVNGDDYSGFAESRTLLSDFLRHELHLYGTHVGCEHGVCGACTVILDNRLARACSILAVQVDGSNISTIEGLATKERWTGLLTAFSKNGALQCGFCSPGIIASTTYLLERVPNPTIEQIRDMLSGHLCRCTGYEGMVEAIMEFSITKEKSKPG